MKRTVLCTTRLKFPTVEPVKAGEQFRFGSSNELTTILPNCKENWRGEWYCATHEEVFQSQFEKDTHIQCRGKHRLIWWCSGHGPEQP